MRIGLMLLILIVGIVIGLFLPNSLKDRFSLSVSPKTSPETSSFNATNNLRVNINSLYRENVILLTSALRRIYNKEPYAPDALEALNENIQDIVDIVGIYYGSEVKKDYYQLWSSQDRFYINYTEGLRDKDKDKKAQAESDLNGSVESSLNFWKKVNPAFNNTTYRVMLTQRVDFLKNFIKDLNNSNISESFKEQHNAYQQNGKIADFLTLSIVKQFPEKFK